MPESERLPDKFLRRLSAIVPAERLDQVEQAFSETPAAGFRINTLRAERDPVLQDLRREGLHPNGVPWYADAFWVEPEEREPLLGSASYRECRLYLQNLSSMLPPLLLEPQPGERVLDLTAAPGSKTLQMACMMKGEGELAAVEIVKSRFFKMRALLEAQGAGFVRTFLQNGERVWRYRPEYFDRVLLDAPCSTEGRFHLAEPATFAYWSSGKIKEMTRKQRRLLFSAVHCLRPGGVLVYSTCTFAPEENEGMVDWVLTRFGDAVEVEPPAEGPMSDPLLAEIGQPPLGEWKGKAFHPNVGAAWRILPNRLQEGFFVCRFRKTASTAD